MTAYNFLRQARPDLFRRAVEIGSIVSTDPLLAQSSFNLRTHKLAAEVEASVIEALAAAIGWPEAL